MHSLQHRFAGIRPSLRTALLGGLLAFAFGALVELAWSQHHWHPGAGCGAWNGVVHGSSSTDGVVHARVERNSCGAYYHGCDLYNHQGGSTLIATDYAYTGDCNATYGGSRKEACSRAVVYYENVFGTHDHLANNWSNC